MSMVSVSVQAPASAGAALEVSVSRAGVLELRVETGLSIPELGLGTC